MDEKGSRQECVSNPIGEEKGTLPMEECEMSSSDACGNDAQETDGTSKPDEPSICMLQSNTEEEEEYTVKYGELQTNERSEVQLQEVSSVERLIQPLAGRRELGVPLMNPSLVRVEMTLEWRRVDAFNRGEEPSPPAARNAHERYTKVLNTLMRASRGRGDHLQEKENQLAVNETRSETYGGKRTALAATSGMPKCPVGKRAAMLQRGLLTARQNVNTAH